MKQFRDVLVSIAAIALCGCASLFNPTPQGGCPVITTTGAKLVAYSSGLGAIKASAPKSVLTRVASNIDATVASGQFDINALNTAFAVAGGSQWAPIFGGVEDIFEAVYLSAVESNLNAQVCTVPVLQNISAGIKQAVALSTKPAGVRLAPFAVKP